MKFLLVLVLIVYFGKSLELNAAIYYVSAEGNDSNSGTSPDQAWMSLAKLSDVQNLFNPGDHILFRRGDVFRDELIFHSKGIEGDSIYFGAYGEGASPVISGSKIILNWEPFEDGIYRAPYESPIQNLFADNMQLVLARHPNSGFIKIDQANGIKGFYSNKLQNEGEKWTGANVLFRTNDWTWEKKVNAGFIPGTIVFKSPSSYPTTDGWGFYLNNHFHALDSINEWYYDQNEGYVYLKLAEGQDPNEMIIEGSVKETGFTLSGNYCSINGINFEKQYGAAIKSTCRHFSISHCELQKICNTGIEISSPFASIRYCDIHNVNGNGISISGNNVKVEYCTLRNIGLYPELSLSGQQQQTGVISKSCSYTEVRYCEIDSTGYSGILLIADSCIIEKNLISNTMMRLNDGGALYCFGNVSRNGSFKNNIIKNVHGCGWAKPDESPAIFQGIYLDNMTNNMLVEGNTIINAGAGIQGNAGTYANTIINNTCYGNHDSQFLLADWGTHEYISDYVINENIWVSLRKDIPPFKYVCYKNICEADRKGTFSGNYYFNPFSNSGKFPGNRTFVQWQNDVEPNASNSFYTQNENEASKTELYINESNVEKRIVLHGSYFDIDGYSIQEFILEPYTSKVVVADKNITGVKGFRNVDESLFSIYPNPARTGEDIRINFPGKKDPPVISLFNAFGSCVSAGQISGFNYTIPDEISPGLYMLIVKFNQDTFCRKIIIN